MEVYNLKFDGDAKTYEDLVKHFFMFHDPTTLNQQGNDMGTQYASAIFCSDQKQVRVLCTEYTVSTSKHTRTVLFQFSVLPRISYFKDF